MVIALIVLSILLVISVFYLVKVIYMYNLRVYYMGFHCYDRELLSELKHFLSKIEYGSLMDQLSKMYENIYSYTSFVKICLPWYWPKFEINRDDYLLDGYIKDLFREKCITKILTKNG